MSWNILNTISQNVVDGRQKIPSVDTTKAQDAVNKLQQHIRDKKNNDRTYWIHLESLSQSEDRSAVTTELLNMKMNPDVIASESHMFKKMWNTKRQHYKQYIDTIYGQHTDGQSRLYLKLIQSHLTTLNQDAKNTKLSGYKSWEDMKDEFITRELLSKRKEWSWDLQACTKKDINLLFPPIKYNQLNTFLGKDTEIQWQWSLGDCYLISAINVLKNHPQFHALMQRSFWQTRDGFAMRLPLWEPGWKLIQITNAELKKAPARWLWYKIIEIAYTKYVTWDTHIDDHKDLDPMYGGNSAKTIETLLWKDNVVTTTINNYTQLRNNPSWMKAWQTNKLIKDALKQWKKVSIEYIRKNMAELDTYLNLTNRKKEIIKTLSTASKNTMITAGTLPGISDASTRKSMMIQLPWDRFLSRLHAYSVQNVIKDKQWNITSVKVHNPWNSKKENTWWAMVELTIDEFCKYFSGVSVSQTKDKLWNHTSTPTELAMTDVRPDKTRQRWKQNV